LKKKILYEIINNKNQCLNTIENNKKLISIYLNDSEIENKTKKFVNKINDVILNLKNFNLIEKVLNHELFTNILKEFHNSDILIAKVDVDLDAKDNDDRNATMYLVDHGRYLQLFKLIKNKDRFDCNYMNINQ